MDLKITGTQRVLPGLITFVRFNLPCPRRAVGKKAPGLA